ncbi:MAG: thiamine-phosphate kinase [Opitutales bacterium]
MFSELAENNLSSLGESSLIERIQSWLGSVVPPPPQGMGDDCAVLEVPEGQYQLLTTDSLTYGQHFSDQVSPKHAGMKLIHRNLSDIAAMGGAPGSALLNLLMGPDLSIDWLHEFIDGIRESCHRYNVQIVGGDVSRIAPGHFSAALTLCGHIEGMPRLRKGAAIGDSIYVTGTLGGSIVSKHFSFEPRLREGQWLAKRSEVTAMMDLTDGLGKDLSALLPVNASAAVERSALPLSEDAQTCSAEDGRSAEAHAFCDGEDYELLFTVAAETNRAQFESSWNEAFPGLRLSRIGGIINSHPAGRYIDAQDKQALPWVMGFEHFKS